MIPERLSHLDVDERRKLPVPFQHMKNDGTWDFTALVIERIQNCVDNNVCGICGLKLGWWKTFLSGPVSAVTRVYTDPPMHEDCCRAALTLCPHLTRENMKRAKTHAGGIERAENHPDALTARPPLWVMATTRQYDVIYDSGTLLFQSPQPFKRIEGWRNKDNEPGLEPVPAELLDSILAGIRKEGFHYQSARR